MITDKKCEFSGCVERAAVEVAFTRTCCDAVTSRNVVCTTCATTKSDAPKATTCVCGQVTRVRMSRA